MGTQSVPTDLLSGPWAESAASQGSVALAMVVETLGSSPSSPGAWMAVLPDGSVVGSVAGGCVEGAVYHSALDVLADGVARVEEYGPDGDLVRPGLTCGGYVSIAILPLNREVIVGVLEHLESGRSVGIDVALDGADVGAVRIVETSEQSAAGQLVREGRNDKVRGGFVRTFRPSPRLVVIGSTAYAQALSAVGAAMGYHVTVCDARPVFTTPERFPLAHQVVSEWPARWIVASEAAGVFDSRTVIVVLTHDPKIDVPLLEKVLDDRLWPVRPAFVGALASSRSAANRREALRTRGLTETQLGRLHSPVGLAIGDSDPRQTAVSIMAQVIAETSSATDADAQVIDPAPETPTPARIQTPVFVPASISAPRLSPERESEHATGGCWR